MNTFYVKIKPLREQIHSGLIHGQGQLNAYIYGTFKAHQYHGDNTYEACNIFGQRIYINVKERIAYIVIDGTPLMYGRITEFCRTEFKSDKYNQYIYQRHHLEIIATAIKDLEKRKHNIIKQLKEEYYGKKDNTD
jgi:hypothetical protein